MRVQKIQSALARNCAEIDARRGVTGWLYRVARNRAVDVMRHRQFEVTAGDAALEAWRAQPAAEPTAGEALAAREDRAAVQAALAALPAAERDVLALRFFGDLAFREIAAALERPLGTVLWLSQRGLARLRRQWRGGAA